MREAASIRRESMRKGTPRNTNKRSSIDNIQQHTIRRGNEGGGRRYAIRSKEGVINRSLTQKGRKGMMDEKTGSNTGLKK